MLKFRPLKIENKKFSILCLGAHSDDIEIGCGGTILRFLKENRSVEITWIVFSANKVRKAEAIRSAEGFLDNAKNKTIIVKAFRDGFFPYIGAEIKEYFEKIKKTISPDIIFTPHRLDLHQDHRLISELTWNTFRDHFILEYEIIKYDGDLGQPNLYVHLDNSFCELKIKNILDCFKSQKDNHWFTKDSFLSILNLRGIESNAPERYAEAFYCRKIIL